MNNQNTLGIGTPVASCIRRNPRLLLFLLALLFIAVDISLVNNDSVWCDEAYTMLQCKADYALFSENVISDAWPPFYAMAVRIFTNYLTGISVPMVKIFSVLPAFLTMLLGVTVIYDEFKSILVSTVFMFMTACMPVSIHMNLELRGYSWAMLFVTCCGVLGYQILRTAPEDVLRRLELYTCYILSALLGAYTHYWALVSIGIVSFLFFVMHVRQRLKNIVPCIVITVVCVICYLPWAMKFFVAAKSVSEGYWIQGKSLLEYMELFLYPYTMEFDNLGGVITNTFSYVMGILSLMLLLYLAAALIRSRIAEKEKPAVVFAICCAGTMILTIAAGFVISEVMTPVFIPRYLTPSLGLLWLFWGIAIKQFAGSNIRLLSIVMAVILITVGFGYSIQSEAELDTGTEEAKLAVRSLMTQDPTYILSDSDYLNWTEIEYYFPESRHYQICTEPYLAGITNEGTIPYLLFLSCDSIPSEWFIERGYDIVEHGEWNFDSCYYFTLYEITKLNDAPEVAAQAVGE